MYDCPECGRMVSDKTVFCRHCGHNMKEEKPNPYKNIDASALLDKWEKDLNIKYQMEKDLTWRNINLPLGFYF